jgi:hypothetical protein
MDIGNGNRRGAWVAGGTLAALVLSSSAIMLASGTAVTEPATTDPVAETSAVSVAVAATPMVIVNSGDLPLPAATASRSVSASSLPATATYRRVDLADLSGTGDEQGGSTTAAGGVGEVVYSNTGADLFFPPGEDRRLGDDVRTLAGCGCTLTNYELLVGGGNDGSGTPFTVSYGIYTGCPDDGGVLIPGTDGQQTLPDDADYLINITPGEPVAIPRRAWIVVSFDRPNAGWYSGSAADANLGVTADVYYLEFFSCSAQIAGGQVYAGFYAVMYCDPDGGLGPASQVFPAEGAVVTDPGDTILTWNSPGSFLDAGPSNSGPVGDVDPNGQATDEAAADALRVDPDWMNKVAHQGCATQEHYEAKLKAAGLDPNGATGGVAGGPCAQGVCGNPSVRDSFIPDESTPENVYRLQFHIFCNDNGSGCTSSVSEVVAQANTINNNFAPYRISFEYEIATHNDSTFVSFDGGDEGPMKSQYAVDPDQVLNMYIVSTGGFSFGTFPWDPDALTFWGGVVQGDTQFSATSSTPTHEIGHCLGLWHTHHGVSEVSDCSICYESPNDPNPEVGDMCADTRPTPTNFNCGNPGGSDPCGGGPWGITDITNYMSYSSCRTEFSLEQAGRMHCWTEDVLSGWLLAQCGATYDVYFGTTNPPVDLICNDLTDFACNPGPLDCGETYYWRVDVTTTETGGLTQGPVWSFSTPAGPDCDNNGEVDACDIAYNGASDCNENNVPDQCEPDCQPNGVADECDIVLGDSSDCNVNGVPDECDPDADGDTVPDTCDICPGGNDLIDTDGDDYPDACDICQGGDDDLDQDFDGIPNFCDTCPFDAENDADADGVCADDDNCPLFNPDQADCQPNGVGDICDIDDGTATDANANNVPDECELEAPFAEDSLLESCAIDNDCANTASCIGGVCYAPKNRYVSIADNPANAGKSTARRVSLDGTVLGWVGPANGNNVSSVLDTPFYADWSNFGLVHLGDCHVSPGHTYTIQSVLDGADIGNEANFSPPLDLPTTNLLGDVGGDASQGLLSPSDGTTNFGDILAVILGFQGAAQAPTVWLDLESESPNYNVGLADAQIAVFGFQNAPYPFADPCSCAGLAPCP